MELRTSYLGLDLRNPLVPSASPLSEDLDNLRRMEDAGAGAVVLQSLFEEQIEREALTIQHYLSKGTESFAESLTYFPEPKEFRFGTLEYLEHVLGAKNAVEIPVIASLNGASLGGWLDTARDIEQAGADALELNLYTIPTDPDTTGAQVEERMLEVVRQVRSVVSLPLAVKLGPQFSAPANMAKKLVEAGANGLVLFNRFYQPDIDLESLEVLPRVLLSSPQAMRLPLRWIAILDGHIEASFAATGGIATHEDVLKMLMVGADVTMICSALLRRGIPHLAEIRAGLVRWMEEHEYVSVYQLKGSMNQRSCADPSAFERAQYVKALTGYHLPI
ncbi:MAG TPA: dihydroorotate dehydrogenase-like protein [Candidatus Polarisedimenticolia bacterium]|jgi:dihydroorotate dehydrogenase (fumarate)|nr:dihydroorotate dehydrogenase-like protein [Candidatus Polarisedimenticolia bacterium]